MGMILQKAGVIENKYQTQHVSTWIPEKADPELFKVYAQDYIRQ